MRTTNGWRDEISAATYDIVEERDVMIPVRDGTRLAANIFRPDGDGPFPALLALGGYGKETQDLGISPQPLYESAMWDGTIEAGETEEIVPRGYVHVIADVRGTGDSEGEFAGMMNSKEGSDGHDLIEWIADQPWCDGHVGMFGYSYFAWTTLRTAIEQPPHLEAIFVNHAMSDFYRDTAYPGGVHNLFYYGLWDGRHGSSGIAAKNPVSAMKRELSDAEFERRQEALLSDPDIRNWPNLYHLLNYPYKNPQYFDMLLNPYDNAFWAERSFYPYFDDIEAPTFVVGKSPHGVTGFWELYEGIPEPKQLYVNPAGAEERPWREDLDHLIRWFDHWLKGNDTGAMDEAPIRMYVPGSNEWRTATTWPPDSIDWTPWYLRRWEWLAMEPERYQDEPDTYLHRPLHVSSRQETVEYTSPTLPGHVETIGPASLSFHASIDQDDTVWIVSLLDVTPGGEEQLVDKSYLKASHRALDEANSVEGRPRLSHTKEDVDPVEPGEITEYTVPMGPISHRFNAGHRIRLEIKSTESPRDPDVQIHYHPKLVSSRTTVHRIYRNDTYRSHLLLPVTDQDDRVPDVMSDDSFLGT